MSSTERRILYKAGGILIAALALLVFFNVITTAEAINITLIFFLVFVTIIYARRTAEISKATKQQAEATRQQADASVKMAEATEKSISEAVRPLVHPRVEFGLSKDTASGQYYIDKMNARFKNIGRGPALHVEVTCHHPYFEYEGPLPEVVLEVGEEVPLYIPSSVSGLQSQKAFELIAKYQNMHGKWFCSRLTQDEHGQHHLEYTELEGKAND